jgi:hypothetical protein
MRLGASSAEPTIIAAASLDSSPLDLVLQTLAQDPNLLRIKKLLIYACDQTWETDSDHISQADLRQLIERLLAIAPTLSHLQSYLKQLVRSLNKSKEYALVANGLITHLNKLYPESQTAQCPPAYPRFAQVAQELDQASDRLRIKKLLIFACKNTWETNSQAIDQIPTLELVQTIYQLTPTLPSLTIILSSLVQSLSKPTEYQQVAEKILQICQVLYQNSSSPTPTPPAPARKASPAAQPVQASAKPARKGRDLSNLFDLRLELMRYTNPLRVKILLFSVLHEPLAAEDDLLLKGHELDDLLRMLLKSYKQAIELESQLYSMANKLPEPAEYIQVASVLLRTIQPFYVQPANQPENPTPLRSLPAQPRDEQTSLAGAQVDSHETTQPGQK